MIFHLSNKLTFYLIKTNCITDEEFSLYAYSLFLLIANILCIIEIILFGLIFKCIIGSIVFYISFRAIRNFAGGYHADTETRCEILTTLSFLVTTYLISISEKSIIQIIVVVGTFFSIIVIAVFAPLDTPAKPLDDDEKRKYRRISLIILSVIVSVILVSLLLKIQLLLVPCCLSLVLEAILLTAGKIKGHLIAD